MILVAEKHFAFDTPVVVDEIRVVEIHAPAAFRRWETAHKQHFRI